MEEENVGWAVFGDELAHDFSIDNTAYGKFILFSFRRDHIQVPASLVNLQYEKK